ncbi:MAG: HU family DNA-binding protein [Chlorobiaceae bacterium]
MINQDLIEELAKLLNVDTQESGRLLNGFFSAMVIELLAVRKLSIKGLGSFTVSHVPLKKKRNATGITYTPPCNKLFYHARISGTDDTSRIALLQLLKNSGEADRFGRTLATVFFNAINQQREIQINGLGCFSKEQGAYGFIPERSLEELLNREYQNLGEVILPQHDTSQDSNESKRFRYALPLALLFVAGVLLAALYYGNHEAIFKIQTILHPTGKVTSIVQSRRLTVPQKPQLAVASKDLSRVSALVDSLDMEKGEYTIVLETFRLEQTALKERTRINEKGIVAYVWPVSGNGNKYYRLVTGKFSTRESAVEHLKGMPEKIAGSAYIQQVVKKGVFYGRKGL